MSVNWFSVFVIKVKLATVIKGNPKVSFSIATTGEVATPFPDLPHFTRDIHLIVLSVKQGDIKYHFLSLSHDSTKD